jgi:hypothetical protein
MIPIGLAAATLIHVSDDGGFADRLAEIQSTKQAFLSCLTAEAPKLRRWRGRDPSPDDLIAACAREREAWEQAMMGDASPRAADAAREAIAPLYPMIAKLAILGASVREQQSVATPDGAPFAMKHVDPRAARAPDPRTPAPAASPPAAGPCGGLVVETDPSALTCPD